MVPAEETTKASEEKQGISAPAITLPKGGGAIHGMGEKFAANPVTGTGSMSVPISTSPGRSGFAPQLALSYDSGAGNGPFGLGWNLSLPSITRKTDKGLPKYQDADESDVFILSGAEDLVPVLVDKGGGNWEREAIEPRIVGGQTYLIQRYRPRIEGLFAQIERWTNQDNPEDTFWRSISKDNITTWYGKTQESRISDPSEPTHIISWLICESYDDKGNIIVYRYENENSDGIDLSQAHEHNRSPLTRQANRYLKHIQYGNRKPYFSVLATEKPWPVLPEDNAWLFEIVFDYGDHDAKNPLPLEPDKQWPVRNDPFSSYRTGFEVRTYRLCQRVLMFHHFPDEQDIGQNCLVRSTDFNYSYEKNLNDSQNPVFSFLLAATQTGYKRDGSGGYLSKSLPQLEFEYSTVPTPEQLLQQPIRAIDKESLENLPSGLDGSNYQWVDLDGEGLSGILTEQADGWFYKPNLSANHQLVDPESNAEYTAASFGAVEHISLKPNTTLAGGQAQFMDLAGDGQADLVVMEGAVHGFYERTFDEDWESFQAFSVWPNLNTRDPNLKFIDLTGDGHADILLSEDKAFVWHGSLAEAGFAPAQRVMQVIDEEKGPRLVFADGTQSIYLADLSGDGLTDLVRIRNGEVCYWPNLGYGRFGTKVTMDNAPRFDNPDQFDQRRISLADIDGSGVTDIIYLHREGVRFYYNQSGNSWSTATYLKNIPATDNVKNVTVVDLLGNGTACLVWSSPLPGDARRAMRYIDLMGGQKPHLLIKSINNLGAETRVHYAPSTKFYLDDKLAGKPWITKLPFPVHVVERVETYDHISRNRFVTRHAYHHGYFDGVEREFRGFGMVEQFDTEEFAALSTSTAFPTGDNIDAASHVPPVHTKTWFHTGIYLGRERVSNFFAGLLDANDRGEYYREPGLTDAQARQQLLDDTILPAGLTAEEEREASRALKGAMLRQEVYALDDTNKAEHPYTVTEQNFTIECLQAQGSNPYAVFFTHAREAISYHYERNPADPRISHALTLEVDDFGNVLKQTAIGYGRRQSDLPLHADRDKQTQVLVTYTENRVSNVINTDDDYRTPLLCEARTYELTGFTPTGLAERFQPSDFVQPDPIIPHVLISVFDAEINYEDQFTTGRQRRLIEQVRSLYRPNDMGTVPQNDPLTLLPPGKLESLALPGESYKLAFTPVLLAHVYQRPHIGQPPENLILDPVNMIGGQGADQGGFVDLDGNGRWWIPSGRMFHSPNSNDTATQELTYARQHFFLPQRNRSPFHTAAVRTESFVSYDNYDLLHLETRDPLGNRVTVGERDVAGNLTIPGNDYRVLQPRLVMDSNRNRATVAFDILGMVVGTAIMGKPEENLGDSLAEFEADLNDSVVFDHLANPLTAPQAILQGATTRLVYDLFAYFRTKADPFPQPAAVYTLARETHDADLIAGQPTKIQHGFSYSDGFGREIQKKIQAEPGPLDPADPASPTVDPRWVGSGWTIFNNKGKPVRQYEPFFSATHRFEFANRVGVSPILFYDPVERVVATLHPNHTFEKVVFNPWRQESWDVNDTALIANPKTDPDVGDFFQRIAEDEYLPTWYAQRQGGALGVDEQTAAAKTAIHAGTPSVAHADSLGRTFLTIAHNKTKRSDTPLTDPPTEEFFATRVIIDIEGNQREVIDAKDRIVMRYDYDMLGNRIHQASMEAGERWMLNDVTGKPIRAWDSREHTFRTEYDPLRRPLRSFALNADPAKLDQELLTDRSVYGEQHPEAVQRNLRGKLYLHLDQAGVMTSERYDFKGNGLEGSRRLAREYKQALDWSPVDAVLPDTATTFFNSAELEAALVPRLETDIYTSHSLYDALNRPVQLIAPRNNQPGAKRNVIQPGYNEANLLERVDVWLDHPTEPTGLLDRTVVPPSLAGLDNIDYDAKGQRLRINYKNGATTRYVYDPETFRLTHLYTRRGAAFTGDCGNDPPPPLFAAPDVPPPNTSCGLQNLHYTYDPAGNITHIRDDAQQTIYFRNQRVEPSADYTYDALYRLIEATGREHLGQVGGTPIQHSYNDAPRVGIAWSANDSKAMGTYLESYLYDAVGNFQEMQHRHSALQMPDWTRGYTYHEASLIEPGKMSNRLTQTSVGGTDENYSIAGNGYDAHGNMLSMPHLSMMSWDFRDQLQATAQQVVIDGIPEITYYVYDAGGQRVRKVTELQNGKRKNERVYLGGFEVYREYDIDGNTVKLERETLHIMDDKQRIALVETKTITNPGDDSPGQLIRYQFGNHLGSASLELDHLAQIISYEEYTPYGSTSYQAVNKDIKAAAKRYRYTGMERDEENGFNYHGARYYAGWLGRWTISDPIGIKDDLNSYAYVHCSPINFQDRSGTDGRTPLPPATDWNAKYPELDSKNPFTKLSGTDSGKPFPQTTGRDTKFHGFGTDNSSNNQSDGHDECKKTGCHKLREDLPASHPFNRHPALSPLVAKIPDENKERVMGAMSDIWHYPLAPISLPVRAVHFVTSNLVNMAVDVGLGPLKGDPAHEELVAPIRKWGPTVLDVPVTAAMGSVLFGARAGMADTGMYASEDIVTQPGIYYGNRLITTEGGVAHYYSTGQANLIPGAAQKVSNRWYVIHGIQEEAIGDIPHGWVIKQTMSNPELVPSVTLDSVNLDIQFITNNPAVVNQWIRQQGAKAVKSVFETQ